MTHSPRQRGFSLLEMAFVLAIIGLLIGGILQARNLIRASQVQDTMSIARDLSAASQFFKTRYHYLPGDWSYTANEIPNVLTGGNGNGLIDSVAESANVPNHLFNSGFIKGGVGQIRSRYGAVRVVANRVGVGSVVRAGPNPVPVTVLNLIEFDNLDCDVAMEIDLKLDDGNLATGSVRASVANCVSGGANDPVPSLAIPL